MELVDPIDRVGDEEVAYLTAAEIENVCTPVELLATHRVGVLVERGAVEARESPLVLGEVRWNPIDENGNPQRVQMIDQVAEVVGMAEARRRRVIRRHLIAPRAAERMLGDR